VAPDLIGVRLVRRLHGEVLSGRIVETEAYMGSDDPASHAYRGMTKRNRVMFGPPGHLYVYRSYGIHNCANVVTGQDGGGSAVLIRAVEPLEGLATMRALRRVDESRLLASGPGRVCESFGITIAEDGTDLLSTHLWLAGPRETVDVSATPRIGISVATDACWRFVEAGSRFASRRTR
jgi:DNA-3-methyladenine glycosylase